MATTSSTVKRADRTRVLLSVLAFMSLAFCHAQRDALLDRTVTIQASQVKLSHALDLVALKGRFKLSYNAGVIPVDSMVDVDAYMVTVRLALLGILPEGVLLRETGDHVIITGEVPSKQRVQVEGRVTDGTSGDPLARVSVLEVRRSNAVMTGSDGHFKLTMKGSDESSALLFGRNGYRDTVIFLNERTEALNVRLVALEHVERVEPLCIHERCGVQDLGVAQLLVPRQEFTQAENLSFGEERPWQLSVLPGIGTNGEAGGAMVNKISLNVLAGYARGVNGAELGLGVNIDAWHVKGAQFAGIANLVGGEMDGFQLAGGINHTMRSMHGLQLSGLGNVVWDTLAGAQVAGGVNVAKGDMRGTQVGGATNVAIADIDGTQIAGGVNITVGDVRKAQLAGGLNYGKNVSGLQFAFGGNIAAGDVGGGQVAGGMNYARSVEGGQVAFGMNLATGTVRGGQVGVLNVAKHCDGAQVGILNLADSLSGNSYGILSISRFGFHRAEIFTSDLLPWNLQVRTGVKAFHNILGWSPPLGPDEHWGFRYGFGSEIDLGTRLFLDLELTGEQVNERSEWIDALNLVGRFGTYFGFRMSKRLILSAGASLDLLTSDWKDPETGAFRSTIAPSDPIWERSDEDILQQAWIGWRIAVGVEF